MEFFQGLGLWGLLGASFLAATILPFSSEVVLGWLLLQGYPVVQTVAVATLGNVLGSLVNYGMGMAGTRVLTSRFLRVSPREIQTARQRFKTHGLACLLFAWVPVVGDPITLVAGILEINIWIFLFLVTLGKLLRYVAVAWAALSL